MRNKIVLLEGGEGAGKTTLAARLVTEQGFRVVKFPSPGTQLESIIFSKTASLGEKAAAATLDFCQKLREELAKPGDIVLDRGPWSTIAYQGPSYLWESVMALDAIWTIKAITDIIFLDVDVKMGLEREVNKNPVSAAGIEFHSNVAARMRTTFDTLVTGKIDQDDPTWDAWTDICTLPWTNHIHKIDTSVNDADTTYMEVLEKLGLVKSFK